MIVNLICEGVSQPYCYIGESGVNGAAAILIMAGKQE